MTAPTTTNFGIEPLEGIDFNTTYTAYDSTAAQSTTNDPSYPAPPFTVGSHGLGNNGTEYVFVKAAEAITQYAAVYIDKSFNAGHLTLAKVRALSEYGFAQVAIASGTYGWVAIRGSNLGVLARLSSLANVPVYISNVSAGRVTTTSVRNTSGGTLVNVVLTTSSTTSPSGAVVAVAPWPGTSRVNG